MTKLQAQLLLEILYDKQTSDEDREMAFRHLLEMVLLLLPDDDDDDD